MKVCTPHAVQNSSLRLSVNPSAPKFLNVGGRIGCVISLDITTRGLSEVTEEGSQGAPLELKLEDLVQMTSTHQGYLVEQTALHKLQIAVGRVMGQLN